MVCKWVVGEEHPLAEKWNTKPISTILATCVHFEIPAAKIMFW